MNLDFGRSRDRGNESRLSGLHADPLGKDCPNSRRFDWEISKINPLEMDEKSKDEVVTNFFNEQDRPTYLEMYANRWEQDASKTSVGRQSSSPLHIFETTANLDPDSSTFRPVAASRPSRKSYLQTSALDRTGEVSGNSRRNYDLTESSLPIASRGLLAYPEVGKLGVEMSSLYKLQEENLESLEKSKSLLRDVHKMKRTCVKLKTSRHFEQDRTALDTTLARTGYPNMNHSTSHLGLSSIHHFELEKTKTANCIDNTEYCLMKAIDLAADCSEKSNYKTSNFNERVVFEFDENHNPNVELLPNLKPQTLKADDSKKALVGPAQKEPLGDATNLLQVLRQNLQQSRFEADSAIGARREAFQQKTVDSKFFSFRGNYILQDENRTPGQSRLDPGKNYRAFNPSEKVDFGRHLAPSRPPAGLPLRGQEPGPQYASDDFDMTLKSQTHLEEDRPVSTKAIRFD